MDLIPFDHGTATTCPILISRRQSAGSLTLSPGFTAVLTVNRSGKTLKKARNLSGQDMEAEDRIKQHLTEPVTLELVGRNLFTKL